MPVVMMVADRASFVADDPLRRGGGGADDRADGCSSFLAYAVRYELQGDTVVHHIAEQLSPNWWGEEHSRPFSCDGSELVLRTPPIQGTAGRTAAPTFEWDLSVSAHLGMPL